ncbi:hypothetical protein CEXT_333961 [Caerostris extrusa]|uniref:Uncharacterized protein n=1 Tax=Caerostris extrusa TaxID=172846 RepID=A0AAV4XYY9_CAEEX|nr:hypothetical protein CEXT_333961 [Caerostris extrusa]
MPRQRHQCLFPASRCLDAHPFMLGCIEWENEPFERTFGRFSAAEHHDRSTSQSAYVCCAGVEFPSSTDIWREANIWLYHCVGLTNVKDALPAVLALHATSQ